jgi:toxin secretion/phage lysis holin
MNGKLFISTVAAMAGGIFTYLFGPWSMDIATLLIFMAIDFITGLLCAAVFKKSSKTESGALSSSASFKGLCKKFVMFLFVAIAHRLDFYLGVDFMRGAVIVGFMANELISIVENAALMGITSPIINNAIELLKKKGEKGDE